MEFLDEYVRQTVFLFLTLTALPACQSKPDPPKEAANDESAPIVSAPSASGSSAPVPAAPSASASAANAAPEPAPQSIDPEKVTALLVWRTDSQARGGYRTQWVERNGDKPRVVDERPGILFASSTSLWTLETTIVKGCSRPMRDDNGTPVMIEIRGKGTTMARERPDMKMPELTRISDGQRVAPWKDGHGYPYSGTQCPENLRLYGVSVDFMGGMGPFVVARMRTSLDFEEAAHGTHGEEFFSIDLEKAAPTTLLPPEVDRAAVVANAANGLGVEPKEVHPNGTLLLYGPNGMGLAVYRYWASSSYAGGVGGNSYTNDFEVSSKNLPAEVIRFDKLPAWALTLLKPKSVPVFMIPPARMELFKSQFDAAYAGGKQL